MQDIVCSGERFVPPCIGIEFAFTNSILSASEAILAIAARADLALAELPHGRTNPPALIEQLGDAVFSDEPGSACDHNEPRLQP